MDCIRYEQRGGDRCELKISSRTEIPASVYYLTLSLDGVHSRPIDATFTHTHTHTDVVPHANY